MLYKMILQNITKKTGSLNYRVRLKNLLFYTFHVFALYFFFFSYF
jgi:hypothetical protein